MLNLILLLLLLPIAAEGAAAPEAIVRRHLDWLAAHESYRAGVTIRSGEQTTTGTLFVDLAGGKRMFIGKEETLPPDVFLKAAGLGPTTALFAYSKGAEREDDLPFAELRLPPGPFADGSYDLFVRGQSLEATMNRIETIAEEVAVLPASALGAEGLRLTLQRALPAVLLDMLGEALGLEASSPQTTPDAIILWFDGHGRLDAAALTRADGSLDVEVRLAHDAVDVPLPELAGPLFHPWGRRGEQPGPVARAAAELTAPEPLAEPVLNTWLLIPLSVVLLAACGAVVVRLVRLSAQERDRPG